eukprot:INCI19651.1.p2 GENE.INCI19651.1~~INCI19651.1.p2  ORF type:complete len:741 (+),score=117.16 INCI19651.1:238-2460(+)
MYSSSTPSSSRKSGGGRPRLSYSRRMVNSMSPAAPSSSSFSTAAGTGQYPAAGADAGGPASNHFQKPKLLSSAAQPSQGKDRPGRERGRGGGSLYSQASRSLPNGMPPRAPGMAGPARTRAPAPATNARAPSSGNVFIGGMNSDSSDDEGLYHKARFNGVLYLSNRDLREVPEQVYTLFDPKWRRPEERWWEQVPALQKLDLSHNLLPWLPSEMHTLGLGLQVLLLKGNELRECSVIAAMVQLRILNLSDNQLSSLPSLDSLRELTDLDVSSNQLQELPLLPSSLARLDCSQNQLHELGPEFEALEHLHEIHAGNNQLTSIAAPLGVWCPALRVLHLPDNRLEDLPESLSHLSELQILDARKNQLCIFPVLPESSGGTELSALKELRLSNNQLPEVDPSELSKVASSLVIFDVASNFLEDLPGDVLSTLQILQHLDISNNRIGEVPASLGSLHNLRSLKIEGNPIRDARLREALEAGVTRAKEYLLSRIPMQPVGRAPHQSGVTKGGENDLYNQPSFAAHQPIGSGGKDWGVDNYYHPSREPVVDGQRQQPLSGPRIQNDEFHRYQDAQHPSGYEGGQQQYSLLQQQQQPDLQQHQGLEQIELRQRFRRQEQRQSHVGLLDQPTQPNNGGQEPLAEIYCRKVVVIDPPEPQNFLGGTRRNSSTNKNDGQLQQFPPELFAPRTQKMIEQLSISRHALRVIPSGIACLSSLHALRLDNNRIQALPVEIMMLRLKSLELQGIC